MAGQNLDLITRITFIKQFENCYQQHGESILSYANRLRALGEYLYDRGENEFEQRLINKMLDTRLVVQFESGILPDLQHGVKTANPKSFNEAIEIAKEIEARKYHVRDDTVTVNEVKTEAYPKGDSKAALFVAILSLGPNISSQEFETISKRIADFKDSESVPTDVYSGDDEVNARNIHEEAFIPIEQVSDNDNDPAPKDVYSIDDEENVRDPYEDASMPIKQVSENYQSNIINPNLHRLQENTLPMLPVLKVFKSCVNSDAASSSGRASASGSSLKASETSSYLIESTTESSSESSQAERDTCNMVSSSCSYSVSTRNGEPVEAEFGNDDTECTSNATEIKSEETVTRDKPINEEIQTVDCDVNKSATIGQSTPGHAIKEENRGASPLKGKDEVIMKKTARTELSANAKNLRARNARQSYSNLFDFKDEDEEKEHADLYEDEDSEYTRNMSKKPGADSGGPTVVALFRSNEFYFSNAGDARCTVGCRQPEGLIRSSGRSPDVPWVSKCRS